MSAAFDVNASFPADTHYREAVRAMAVQAAQHAGSGTEPAERFAAAVAEAFVAQLSGAARAVTIRLECGPQEVAATIDGAASARVVHPVAAN